MKSVFSPRFFLLFLLLSMLFIFLCSTCDFFGPDYSSLTGHVLDSIGGSPVEGAAVVIKGTEFTTNTDSDGFFDFQGVLAGVYDIVVTKTGMAGSKLEQVDVMQDHQPVEIILPKYNYMADAATPPSITLTSIERGKNYSGIITIYISIKSGSCPVTATEFHRSIYLKIGLTTLHYYEVASSSDNTLMFQWNTSLYPPGEVIIKVVAYDSNNNRSEMNIPVFVTSVPGNEPNIAPLKHYYSIIANTYGQSMEILRVFPDYETMLEQSLYTSRAPADSTVLVNFSVEKYYNGIVVYKSFTEEGPYTIIGQTSYVDSYHYKCVDYGPDLEPGTTVYYKLAYFNTYGIGPQTDSISVRILPKYNLSLVSPADHSIVTDTTVPLTWTCDPFIEDAQRTDWIIASNILDATIVAYTFKPDTTEFILEELLYNNSYEWDIRSYYEYCNSEGIANVLSRSFPRGNMSHDFSLNGSFIFTVIQQE